MEQVLAPGKHAASWPAIIAGAFVAVAVTLILISLGSGIGFASISPWQNRGVSATSFAITTAIWLIVTQWISAALGGYISGRLRTRWIGTHSHEIFFRDTAHGLITWAVASVAVFAVAAMSTASGLGAGAHAAVEATSAAGQAASLTAGNAYSVDKLFRSTSASTSPSGTSPSASTSSGGTASASAGTGSSDPRLEAMHIVANAGTTGGVSEVDRSYLVDQVSARTGLTQQQAQARVDEFIASLQQGQEKLKAEADGARKAAAQASIYLALSLLVGAFIASVSAALGGRLRDEHP